VETKILEGGNVMKKLDFLPEDYLEKKAQQRTNIICMILFLLVMGGVTCGFIVTERRQQEMDSRVEEINKEMLEASESLKQLELLDSKREEMMTKASISASLMEPVPRSLLLATITNELPVGISLKAVNLESKKIKPKAKVVTKSRSSNKRRRRSSSDSTESEKKKVVPEKWATSVSIEGYALTDIQVSDFISGLNDSKLFKEVNLMYSEEYNDNNENLRLFELEAILDPEVRASEADVEMARKKRVSGM
jgi:hypothetical protein